MTGFDETSDVVTFTQVAVFPYLMGLIFACVGLYTVFVALPEKPWFGLIFAGVGVILILFTKSSRAVIDRRQKMVRVTSVGLLGKQTVAFGFDKITTLACVDNVSSSSRGSSSQRSYSLTIRCVDGNEYVVKSVSDIAISVMGIPVGPSSRKSLVELGEKLARYMSVPFVDQKLPSLGETLSTIASTVRKSIEKAQAEKAMADNAKETAR